LTAGSLSSGAGITGTTVSAVLLLAGNFQSTTAAFNTRVSGLETATGNLSTRSTGLETATGSLQTQVGSLWNSKIPYTGASANVNLAAQSLTAASISSLSITATGSISSLTLSAGNFRVAKLWFGDGTSMITASSGGSSGGSGVPYTGATANVDLSTFSLSAASVTASGAISGSTISALTERIGTLFFNDGTFLATAAGGTSGVPYNGAVSGLNLATQALTASKITLADKTTISSAPYYGCISAASSAGTTVAFSSIFTNISGFSSITSFLAFAQGMYYTSTTSCDSVIVSVVKSTTGVTFVPAQDQTMIDYQIVAKSL
jgi:hypothetical protein